VGCTNFQASTGQHFELFSLEGSLPGFSALLHIAQQSISPWCLQPSLLYLPSPRFLQAGLDEAAAQLQRAAAVIDSDPATTENRIVVLTGRFNSSI